MSQHEISADTPPTTRARVLARLKTSRLLRGCDDEFVRDLASRSSLHRHTRGERVWIRGTHAEHFHQVTGGVLELRRSTAGRDPTLVALFGTSECPAVPVALERGRYIADAYAASATLEILRVPAEPILARLAHDVVLATAVRQLLLDHSRLLHSKIDVLTAGSVQRRIAIFLADLAERFGDEREDGSTAIPLALSRAQIASYVDAREETVIRCLSAWRRDGLLVLEPDAMVVPALERFRQRVFQSA